MRTCTGNLFILFILVVIPILPGCKAQTKIPIQGHIELDPGWKPIVYLIRPVHFQEIAGDYLGEVIDFAEILPDGNFAFKESTFFKTKALFILAVQPVGSRHSNQLMNDDPAMSNYMPVVYSPGAVIEIRAKAISFQSSFSLTKTSKENSALLHLRDIRGNAFKEYTQSTFTMQDDSLLIEKEKAYHQYIGKMVSFADTTSVIEAAMVAIRWISPTNDYERIPEFAYDQCEKWSALQPSNTFLQEFCAMAQKTKLSLMIGERFPDFKLPLLDGDTVPLYSLLGKQLTIVDIWASWCAPCRKESREELVPMWNQYRDKGFQIIGYSIDANDDPWRKAISKDGSGWTHSSHLTGDSTPLMDALRISIIPANYLLDEHGKIIAKNLHGRDLATFVTNYLN